MPNLNQEILSVEREKAIDAWNWYRNRQAEGFEGVQEPAKNTTGGYFATVKRTLLDMPS